MRNWQAVAVVVGIAWLGAFAISFAVAEWRADDDSAPQAGVQTGSPTILAGDLTTVPTPERPATVVIPAVMGTTADWLGIRFTLDEFRTQESSRGVSCSLPSRTSTGIPLKAQTSLT
jgi:hypothetical protein